MVSISWLSTAVTVIWKCFLSPDGRIQTASIQTATTVNDVDAYPNLVAQYSGHRTYLLTECHLGSHQFSTFLPIVQVNISVSVLKAGTVRGLGSVTVSHSNVTSRASSTTHPNQLTEFVDIIVETSATMIAWTAPVQWNPVISSLGPPGLQPSLRRQNSEHDQLVLPTM